MIGWAAYNEIENEEYEKQKEQAQRSSCLLYTSPSPRD